MAARFFLNFRAFIFFILTSLLSHSLSAEKEKSPVSLEWKNFENDLNLHNQLQKLSKELAAGRISIAQVQSSLRYTLDKAFSRPPTFDPELGHTLVTSAALSELPSASGLMQKVLMPENHYPIESWQCALQYLSQQPSEKACELLIKCLGMPWISLNLSASFYLSQNTYAKHDPNLIPRLQAVQRRLPKNNQWIMADVLSRLDTPAAATWMRQLFSESSVDVQTQMLRLMSSMEEDFLSLATKGLSQQDPGLLEASLYYCLLRNHLSANTLELCQKLCESKHSRVAQTAQITIYKHTQSQESLEFILKSIDSKELHTLSACCLLAQMSKEGLHPSIRAKLTQLTDDENSKIALNASLALLMSHDCECLESISNLILDDQVLISIQHLGTNSWPFFVLEWIPPKDEPFYSFVMATQHRSKAWLLDQVLRLKKTELTSFFSKMLTTNQEPLQVLFVEAYKEAYQDTAQEALLVWANEPGKPWLRVASTLSLWQLRHNPNDIAKLLQWWSRFDWPSSGGYISTLPDEEDSEHKIENAWLLDFQTSFYFTVTRELLKESEPKTWSILLEKLSKNQSLKTLPLLALMIKSA